MHSDIVLDSEQKSHFATVDIEKICQFSILHEDGQLLIDLDEIPSKWIVFFSCVGWLLAKCLTKRIKWPIDRWPDLYTGFKNTAWYTHTHTHQLFESDQTNDYNTHHIDIPIGTVTIHMGLWSCLSQPDIDNNKRKYFSSFAFIIYYMWHSKWENGRGMGTGSIFKPCSWQ